MSSDSHQVDAARVAVIIGAGQLTSHIDESSGSADIWDLLETVARVAAVDAGDPHLLARLSHLWLVHSITLGHADPSPRLASRLGARRAEARYGGAGGAGPQWLINRAAELVLSGGQPLVLIVGAEALASRRHQAKVNALDHLAGWHRRLADEVATAEVPQTWPAYKPYLHPVEMAHGLDVPVPMYAMIETAMAHRRGGGLQQRQRIGSLMERFNATAASNPQSWYPTRRAAQEIVTPSPDNRWVCYPYTKYMCAIMDVDMAAGVIVTDLETAMKAGLGPSDVAFVRGWADANEVQYVSERPVLYTSTAIAECARSALRMAGIALEEITAFDLYACFPSSIEASMGGLGITVEDRRPFTLTGGLPYHGGPGSNYVSHALGNVLERIRAGGDEHILVQANGGYLTSEAVGIYSSKGPATAPIPDYDVQSRVCAQSIPVSIDPSARGRGSIVAYTVPFDRDGSHGEGVLIATVAGRRTVALADDELTKAFLDDDLVDQPVLVTATASGNRATAA